MPLVPKLIINPLDRIVGLGDSITPGWYGPLNAYLDAAYFPSTNIARVPGLGGVLTTPAGSVRSGPNRKPVWINSGGSGNTTGDVIAAGIPARVTNHNPNVLFIELGANDVVLDVANATFEANYTQIIVDSRAVIPALRIACFSVLCKGENWPNGANAYDTVPTGITAKNAIIAAVAAAQSCTYVDVRTPLLAELPTLNPGHLDQGFWTSDNVHPNAYGRARWSYLALNQMTLVGA